MGAGTAGERSRRGAHLALGALLLAAAAHYAWNAYRLPPLGGYDAAGHAAYALTIAREGRLPAPLEGWSTFHPPLYYGVGAGVWRALEPLGPRWLGAGLRGIGALAWLAAGLVGFRLVRRLGGGPATACAAAALLWFAPVNQFAAMMVGNEALAAALAAFALPFLVRLQDDPRDLRAALGAACFAGLALASKYTGAWVAAACAVPFARRDLDRRGLRALAACALVGAALCAPVYARNWALSGSPLPMTRERDPMRSAEAALVLRPRRLADFLWIDPGALRRPSIYHVAGQPGDFGNLNPAMASVWGLVYAGLWYDPFGHRVPIERHRDGVWLGPPLLLLGAVPTALVLAGLLAATRDLWRRRGRSADAPLAVMTWVGLVSFAAFLYGRAPSLAAAKASYLMPLAAPAAVFFARGAGALGRRARALALSLSLVAALAAATVFTAGVVIRPETRRIFAITWLRLAQELPGTHLDEAVGILYGLRRVESADELLRERLPLLQRRRPQEGPGGP